MSGYSRPRYSGWVFRIGRLCYGVAVGGAGTWPRPGCTCLFEGYVLRRVLDLLAEVLVSSWRSVAGGSSEKSRVAALVRHGSDPAAVARARQALGAANIRRTVDEQRARVGLPPVADDLAAVLTAAAFLGEAAR